MPARANPLLAIRGLWVRRGETLLVRDLSWTVRSGERWVLLGRNGSGKTSLLLALTGYLPPSRGEIELDGAEYGRADWREIRRRVGVVSAAISQSVEPTEPALHVVASGRDASLNLWHAPSSADRQRARRLLRQLGVRERAHHPWAVLSQGERQRLLIARALMGRPTLLILDEPCAGLDPVARDEFLRFLQTLAASPRTPAIVLVTHHLEEITPAFTHALLLEAGGVKGAGPLEKMLRSKALSALFGERAIVRRRAGRWSLAFR